MTEAPAVSVVIPCRNEVEHIDTCLASLVGQERPPGGFEIIVADGLSDDGTRDVLAKFARHYGVRVIDNPGRIVSTALNAAIKVARGNVIVRIDAHTEYASDYIRECLAVLEETGADAVGGPWVARGRGAVGRGIAAAFQSPFCAGPARAHNPTYAGPIDVVYLGCWRRELFDRIGFFDEDLVRNQDDEFSLRLIRAGGIIWQSPRIRSWYTPRGSLRALFRQYAQYGYWKVRVIKKHRLPASLRQLVPASFVVLLALLSLAAPWFVVARWALIGLVGVYVSVSMIASLHAAARSERTLFALLPLVFACYHFGYGFGFLHGIWDVFVLRRHPRSTYATLTRIART